MEAIADARLEEVSQGLKFANVGANRTQTETAAIEEEEAQRTHDLIVLNLAAPILIPEDDLLA